MNYCKECGNECRGAYCSSCFVYFHLEDLEEERQASKKENED